MRYFNKFIKLLSVLFLVLMFHALIFWQVLQHIPEKPKIQSSKPIMVTLITPTKSPKLPPSPILPKKNVAKNITKDVTKKVVKRRIISKKVNKKPKRKKIKRTKLKPTQPFKKRTFTKKPRRTVVKKSRRTIQTVNTKVTRQQDTVKNSTDIAQGNSIPSINAQQNHSYNKKNGGGRNITRPASYKATYLHNPRPPYPRISKRRREQGKVLLRVKVTRNGRAASVQISKSSGSKRLDNAARKTVKGWRFVPAKKVGKTVSGWVLVPIIFKLS